MKPLTILSLLPACAWSFAPADDIRVLPTIKPRRENHTHSSLQGTGALATPPSYPFPSNFSSAIGTAASTGGILSYSSSSAPFGNQTASNGAHSQSARPSHGTAPIGTGLLTSSSAHKPTWRHTSATVKRPLSTGGTGSGTGFPSSSVTSSAPYLNSTAAGASTKPFPVSTGGTVAGTGSPTTFSNGAHSQPSPIHKSSSSAPGHPTPLNYGPPSSSVAASTVHETETETLSSTVLLPKTSSIALSTGTASHLSASSANGAHSQSAPYSNSSSTIEPSTIVSDTTAAPPAYGPPPTYGAPAPTSSSSSSEWHQHSKDRSESAYVTPRETGDHSPTTTTKDSSVVPTASNGAHSQSERLQSTTHEPTSTHHSQIEPTAGNGAHRQSARPESATHKISLGTGSFTTSTVYATETSGAAPTSTWPTYLPPPPLETLPHAPFPWGWNWLGLKEEESRKS